MSIRKINANNMSEGLRRVREELGPDALIINTVSRNGKVELFVEAQDEASPDDVWGQVDLTTRAAEGSLPRAAEGSLSRTAEGSLSRTAEGSSLRTAEGSLPRTAEGSDASIHEAYRRAKARMLNSLGDKVEGDFKLNAGLDDNPTVSISNRARGSQRADGGPAPGKNIKPSLDFSSFDTLLNRAKTGSKTEKTVASLVDGLQLDVAIAARVKSCQRIDELIDNLALMIKTDAQPARGIKAFVGPSGSGKSTSLIKLITRQVMQFGPGSCAIINCDRYRAGAKEQLTRLGEITDVQVLHVNGEFTLNQAIAKVAHRQLILIDMPGLSMSDEHLSAELFKISSSNYDIGRYLVLPANLQPAVMRLAAETYINADNCSCILTRLDECDTLGPALSFLAQKQLPLAFTTNGTHIPEDMAAARSLDFVHSALTLMDRHTNNDQFAKGAMSDFTYRSIQTEENSNMVMDV